MLGKLLKHEFAATARYLWVLYVAMLGLSVAVHFAFRFYDRADLAVLRMAMTMAIILWVLSLIFCGIGTLVLMIRRFYQNLLTDEGYLMFTLPVSVHELVISKLIAAVVWMLASVAVIVLCVLVATFDSQMAREVLSGFRELLGMLDVNSWVIGAEMLLLTLVGTAASCLQFYSAMAIGHGFAKSKALLSVVFYFVQSWVLSFLGNTIGALLLFRNGSLLEQIDTLNPMQTMQMSMLFGLGAGIVVGAIFYVLTVVNLQKRLNLG